LYENERAQILGAIGAVVLGIEHIGSTSVPDLAAKPIIDIQVRVRTLAEAEQCAESLSAIGYEYKSGAFVTERYFRKPGCHLHMVPVDGPAGKNEILFRNYLRCHPETVARYASLKRDWADKFPYHSVGYTKAKTAFIQSVVDEARAEKGLPPKRVSEEDW
jgi:GrpB-like predicted nucleotidyltransferase (UPF0157 family)